MSLDSTAALLMLVIILIFLGGLGVLFAINAQQFLSQLRYLNMEIERTTGSERKYWIRERRRLWLSLFTFGR